MAVKVQSLSQIFDGWFGASVEELEKDEHFVKTCMDTYGFLLRVVVSKDIPPRHSYFSWIRGMGVTKFDELFQGELSRVPDEWMLGFPERHCSLDEQQKLIYQFVKLQKEGKIKLKCLDIITQSPFIISDCKMECVKIIAFPEGKKTYNQDYM